MEENQNQELEQEQVQEQIETEVQDVSHSNEDQLAEIQAQKAELDKLKKEMFQKDVQFTLKESGLEKFASIVKVENEEELKEVVGTLSQIVTDIKISTGYVPAEHKQVTSYDQAKQQGNTKGMIKSLFGFN